MCGVVCGFVCVCVVCGCVFVWCVWCGVWFCVCGVVVCLCGVCVVWYVVVCVSSVVSNEPHHAVYCPAHCTGQVK